jgi:hypothetical protein
MAGRSTPAWPWNNHQKAIGSTPPGSSPEDHHGPGNHGAIVSSWNAPIGATCSAGHLPPDIQTLFTIAAETKHMVKHWRHPDRVSGDM